MSEEKINNSNEDNNFELRDLYNFILRNKKIFIVFIISSFVLGVFNAYRAKKIWQGEFQIVIEKDENDQLSRINEISLERFGINSENKKILKTELKILESPLVLSEVFKYVNAQKLKENKGQIKKISFKDWKKKNLIINLENGTSVLNLSYRDSQKELIIPVLEKISRSYQDYSNRKRLRNIDLSKTFFEEQINFYKEKSLTSLKNIEKFANDQNLLSIQVFSMNGMNDDFIENINLEAMKILNFNEIKKIEMQLKNLKAIEDNKNLFYFANSFKGFYQDNKGGQDLLDRIENLEKQILLKKLTYKETDKVIKELIKKKNTLYDLLRKNMYAYLNAKKEFSLAQLKASERPDGVLIKYKQLISEAIKDKEVLSKLETQFRAVLLEEARIQDPWELITEPTLLRYPVAPSKRRIILIYLIFGISSSVIISYLNEKFNFKSTLKIRN